MAINTKASQSEVSAPMGLGYSQQNREKYWGELKTDEKIERLRTLLKSMVNESSNLRSEIATIKEHVHDKDGKAVIIRELRHEYGNMLGAAKMVSQDPDKSYI